MKRYPLLGCLSAGFFTFTPFIGAIAAEEAATASTSQTQASQASGSRLAYGVDDIVKLTRAQVSEEVIATYIQTSGTVYTLRPTDILQLHGQGVSDRIITLMLSQGR